MNTDAAAEACPARVPPFGLSGKLLVLTILFVMIAEVLIYVPSIANYRLNLLRDRLSAAYTAALVFEVAPDGMVPENVARQVLDSIGARAVAVKKGQQRRLLAATEMPHAVDHEIDMRDWRWHGAIIDAFGTLFCGDDDVIRVVGDAPMDGEFVEIVINEKPLRDQMLLFSRNILLLSLLISGITATLVYFALHYLFVRPLRRITANMTAFHEAPEDPARVIAASGRHDEIGTTERELAAMQRDLASMRNAVQALESRAAKDPGRDQIRITGRREGAVVVIEVSDTGPGLDERAIAFCQSTLSYGRVQEPPPDRRTIALEPTVEEVRATLGLERNAVQALESRAAKDPGRDQIRITGRREGAVVVIEVSDTGPGLDERARAHLFEAFQGSTRTGSAGLGLAIAAELVRAHSGEIRLVDGTIGATFRVTIPDRAVELDQRRERVRA